MERKGKWLRKNSSRKSWYPKNLTIPSCAWLRNSSKKRGCYKTEYTIDPDIIGGIVIRIGDKVYDVSLRSRLETIRQSL